MISFKYKGRKFASARSAVAAMQRDLESSLERKVRNVAANSGLSVRKTSNGLEISGDTAKFGRFYDRLER